MRATLLNAPARPLLTRLVLLVLSMALLAAGSLAFALGAEMRDAESAAGRTRFERRIVTLPAVTVTAPEAVQVVPSMQSARR